MIANLDNETPVAVTKHHVRRNRHILRSIAAAEGGALWTGGYVPLDERKSWERIRGGPFLPPPDLLTGTEHGLVKCCDFKTTCNGSRQLSIEHSSPDQLDTAALDSANCY